MDQAGASSEMRRLAERLVALESAATFVSKEYEHYTCRVCEKLRRPLSTLAGKAGFASLLTRALTMAAREVPAFRAVSVKADGSIEGLTGEAAEASPVLIAYLLDLLTTFIGESLVTRLLHDVWPDLPHSEPDTPRKDSK